MGHPLVNLNLFLFFLLQSCIYHRPASSVPSPELLTKRRVWAQEHRLLISGHGRSVAQTFIISARLSSEPTWLHFSEESYHSGGVRCPRFTRFTARELIKGHFVFPTFLNTCSRFSAVCLLFLQPLCKPPFGFPGEAVSFVSWQFDFSSCRAVWRCDFAARRLVRHVWCEVLSDFPSSSDCVEQLSWTPSIISDAYSWNIQLL